MSLRYVFLKSLLIETDHLQEEFYMTPEVDTHEEKGWFKRKKKTNAAENSEPSTALHDTKQNGTAAAAVTTATAGAATSSTSPSDNDDSDLPPRMPSSTHLPRTPSDIAIGSSVTPSTPTPKSISDETETLSEDATIEHIPKHAGFDLEAMKKVIGEANENPSQLRVPSPMINVRNASPVPSSPTPSTPKPPPERFTAETVEIRKKGRAMPTPPPELLEQERKNATPVAGLTESFKESVSLKEERIMNADASPTLTFGSASDAPARASSSTNITPVAIRPERQDSYGLGYNPYKATYTSPSTSSPVMQNPFAMPNSVNDFGYGGGDIGGGNSYGTDTGLSFGTADGTIMNGGVTYGGNMDSWNVPGNYGRKSSSSTSNGFGSNPWS
jgi:hypothetical protein